MTVAVREPVGHYELHLCCPKCGGPVRPITEGVPTGSGSQVQAIVQCSEPCSRHRFQVIALLRVTNEKV